MSFLESHLCPSRMSHTFPSNLNQETEIRTRLMTLYIVMMFIGGAFSSWAGTAAFEYAGWTGSVALAFILSLMVLGLSTWDARTTAPHA